MLAIGRQNSSACLVGEFLYVIGGQIAQGSSGEIGNTGAIERLAVRGIDDQTE